MSGNVESKVLLMIQSYMMSMTKAEKTVAEYVLDNYKEVIYFSITELAERAKVGETTVLRFCRKLNFKGFQDFKLALAQDQAQKDMNIYENIVESDDLTTLIQKVTNSHVRIAEETRKLLDPKKLEEAIQMIVQADKVHFFGVGSSGLAALQAAHTFIRMGKKAEAKQDTHFQAMDASLLSENDVAIGFSVSGSTKDTNENLRIAKEAGAKIICITHNARSPITKISDVDLLMSAWENPLQGSSVAAKMSQLAVIDVLCLGVFLQTKDKAIEYRERTARAVSEKLY